jgi:hypothetical protein
MRPPIDVRKFQGMALVTDGCERAAGVDHRFNIQE